MEKIKLLPNGQWTLEKFDKDYSHIHETHTSIPTGKHTVEIHPHIDRLYNIKGHMAESGKDKIKVSDLKKLGYNKKFIQNHVPKDADGWINGSMLDEHISNLPKHKVDIHVKPYKMGAQQHRPGDQHVVSVQMHEDTHNKMDDEHKGAWKNIKDMQHHFDEDSKKNGQQVGWGRIDPKGHHWHVDEIQSDFQNENKLKAVLGYKKQNHEYAKKMHEILSHGHDDPQHAIHSAINQLARKHNIKSMSMDTPEDQAKQSWLRTGNGANGGNHLDWFTLLHNGDYPGEDFRGNAHEYARSMLDEHENDTAFKSIHDKIGGDKLAKEIADFALHDHSSWLHDGDWNDIRDSDFSDEVGNILKNASDEEQQAVSAYARRVMDNVSTQMEDHAEDHNADMDAYANDPEYNEDSQEEFDMKKLPVHQLDTYHKRPKKLGMKEHDKNEVLGEHKGDKQEKVQYHKLHKKLEQLREALKKC